MMVVREYPGIEASDIKQEFNVNVFIDTLNPLCGSEPEI
jgi:hypothetical protein